MSPNLSGVFVVSGGLGGLGGASARAVLRSGGEVLITGRRKSGEVGHLLDRLAETAGCKRDRVSYLCVEGNGVDQYTGVFENLRVRGAVLSAATVTAQPVLEVTMEALTEMFAVNTFGAFALAQAAARRMRELGEGGAIITFSSIAASRPQPSNSVYGATKAAMDAFMRYMAIELGQYNIRGNSLVIGTVGDEGMAARTLAEMPEFAAQVNSAMPMRRMGTAEEFGRIVAWLLSDDAEYINGAEIAFDGASSLAPAYSR